MLRSPAFDIAQDTRKCRLMTEAMENMISMRMAQQRWLRWQALAVRRNLCDHRLRATCEAM